VRSGNDSAVNCAKDLIPCLQLKLINKIHSTIEEWIKATENEVEVIVWFIDPSKMLPKHENWVGTVFNSFLHSNPEPFGG
jgi:hypothetical protein